MADSDMRWLWAAYRSGSWSEIMDSGLSQPAFSERMTEVIAMAEHDWILEAKGESGNRPVGLILAARFGRGIEPYVEWFSWASTRNKMEATAAFLREASKRHKVFVLAEESANTFWSKFIHYGLIRRGCKVVDYFARGEHAMMFYTVG